jgi:hypothetical protein
LLLGPGWLTLNPVGWARFRDTISTGFHRLPVLSGLKIKSFQHFKGHSYVFAAGELAQSIHQIRLLLIQYRAR